MGRPQSLLLLPRDRFAHPPLVPEPEYGARGCTCPTNLVMWWRVGEAQGRLLSCAPPPRGKFCPIVSKQSRATANEGQGSCPGPGKRLVLHRPPAQPKIKHKNPVFPNKAWRHPNCTRVLSCCPSVPRPGTNSPRVTQHCRGDMAPQRGRGTMEGTRHHGGDAATGTRVPGDILLPRCRGRGAGCGPARGHRGKAAGPCHASDGDKVTAVPGAAVLPGGEGALLPAAGTCVFPQGVEEFSLC